MLPFILKSNGIVLFPAGAPPIQLDPTHINFGAVRDALKAQDFDAALELASVTTFVNTLSKGLVEVSEHGVSYKGTLLSGHLAQTMTRFFTEGLPVDHFVSFLINLMSNPSRTAIQELYLFLESADLPITEDGCFLAYKAVRHDFKDKHSGKFDNSPGQVLDMPRNEVDDVRDRTCSYGYHAAAYEYAKDFLGGGGDRMVTVKINPRDVVSVPSDYKNQKLRTCRYEVMEEIPGAFDTLTGRLHSSQVTPQQSGDAELNWWEADEYNEADYREDLADSEREANEYEADRIRAVVEEALDVAFQDATDIILRRLGH